MAIGAQFPTVGSFEVGSAYFAAQKVILCGPICDLYIWLAIKTEHAQKLSIRT